MASSSINQVRKRPLEALPVIAFSKGGFDAFLFRSPLHSWKGTQELAFWMGTRIS